MGLNVITYALSKKYAKEYTDAVVAALPKAVVYRGVVNFYTDLPAVAVVGDAYSVKFKYTYRLESRIAAPVAWPTDYFTRTGEGTEINPYVYEAVPVGTEYVTNTFYLRRQETDGNEFVYALVVGSEPEIYEWVCLGPDINNDIDGFLVIVVPEGGVLTRLQMESIRDAHLEGRTTVLRLGEETSGVMSMVVTQVVYDDSGSISVFCCFDSGDSTGVVSMYSANAEAETVFSSRELLDSEDEENIYNSIANPNLLTNPDFSINQRGETLYTGTADEYTYTVDRWRIKGEGSTFNTATKEVSLVANGVFEQYVEMPVYLRGESVAATFKVSEYSGEISIGAADVHSLITSPITTISFQVPTDVGGIKVSFINMSGSTVTFKPVFVKLEVGQHSTPLSPPSIAEELIKCQRCYKKWLTDGNMDIYRGNATSSTSVDFIMPMYSMRTAPTVTYSNLYAPCSGHVDESSPAITGVSNVQSDTDCTVITFDTSDQTAFAGYSLQIRDGGYLALDSEVMADILLDLSTTVAGCTLVISDGVDTYEAGSNVISKDTELTITATVSEGYTLDGMTFTVNGEAFTNGGTTGPITANVSIVATAAELFDLAIDAGVNTSIAAINGETEYIVGTDVLPAGTELFITATPSAGYGIATLKVNDVDFTSGTSLIVSSNISIVATAEALPFTIPGDYTIGDSDGPSSDGLTLVNSVWSTEHMDILDGYYTLSYTFDGGTPTDLIVKGFTDVPDMVSDSTSGDLVDLIVVPTGESFSGEGVFDSTLADGSVVFMIVNAEVDVDSASINSNETVTTLVLANNVYTAEGPNPILGKVVSIDALTPTVMRDLIINDTNCTVEVVSNEYPEGITFAEGVGTLPTGYEVKFVVTPTEGYTAEGMVFEVNGVSINPLTDTLIVPAGAVTITATAAEVLAQPFTIPGDYVLSDFYYEDEIFKDSIYEAEHMDILDQWYTLNYTYDALGGGTPTDVLVKGTLDVDWELGFGAMDMILSPEGWLAPLGDAAAFAIINAVIVPGDGTLGDANSFNMIPSEDVTTLIINNELSGDYGEPSPAIGKIVSINSLTATSMQDLIINATGCTVEVQSSEYGDSILFASGTGTLPTGYEIQFVVTPNEGFTAQGMTFEVNGVAFDPLSDALIVPAGAVTITATAVALDLPLVGEIDFNTNSTWNSGDEDYYVDTVPALDFSSVADGDVNLKITVTLDGTPMVIKGTRFSTGDFVVISDLFDGAGIVIASGVKIGVLEGLGANVDMIYLIAPENYLSTHTVVLNSIEIDENIEEILNADISYVYDSVDTFDGTITTQTLDVSGLTNEQDNIYTYWDIDGTRYLVQALSIINGTTTSLQESALLDSIAITLNVNAKIIDTNGTLTSEITGSALTGTEVITLLAVFVDSNI